MNLAKLTVGAVTVLALGAAVLGLAQFKAAGAAADAREVARRNAEDARVKIAKWEAKVTVDAKRADAVESDNAALAGALQKAQAAVAKPVEPAPVPTRAEFDARVKAAVALAKAGEAEAALRELRACWAEGRGRLRRLEPVHATQLLSAWVALGERHPAALTVLREKMEAARQRVLGSSHDLEQLEEMTLIARMLKDGQAMVALHDAIPEGDPRRSMVAAYAWDGLFAAQRYVAALAGRPWSTMSSNFEASSQFRVFPGVTAEAAEKMKAAVRSHAVSTAAKNIEALAGAGDLEHARELAGRVLAYDGSEATRALVQQHLERAGQAGLLK